MNSVHNTIENSQSHTAVLLPSNFLHKISIFCVTDVTSQALQSNNLIITILKLQLHNLVHLFLVLIQTFGTIEVSSIAQLLYQQIFRSCNYGIRSISECSARYTIHHFKPFFRKACGWVRYKG